MSGEITFQEVMDRIERLSFQAGAAGRVQGADEKPKVEKTNDERLLVAYLKSVTNYDMPDENTWYTLPNGQQLTYGTLRRVVKKMEEE